MNVFYHLDELPAFRSAVVTIGSFDGVHRGHQRLLERVNRLAQRTGGESVVITFDKHPRQIVYPRDTSLRLLTTTEEKVALFGRYGVENVVVAPFTIEFSQVSADEYIHKFLVDRFRPRYIVIGYDHRFGLNRQGDINFLRWYGEKLGYEVIEIEKEEVDEITVSSTKVRTALETGDVARAERLLGHAYTLEGRVVHGRKVGNKLGFPTANIAVDNPYKLIPADGIYAVKVFHESEEYDGMLYIGERPTLNDGQKRSIEVNIFDFDRIIYGDQLRIAFVDFIRADQTFKDLDGLRTQLEADRAAVKERLAARLIAGQSNMTPAKAERVAVVILNYNGRDYLQQFLPTVVQETLGQATIYVADNGSTDGSAELMRRDFPEVQWLPLGYNYGYAGGYNAALLRIDADIYVLLNSDVEVTPGWLQPCLHLMAMDPGVGACQPKIRAYHQRDQFEYAGAAGGWIDSLGYPFCRGRLFDRTEVDEGQYDNLEEIFWASGAALFVRAEAFHAVGGFDADYFAHGEEIDLCWRLKLAGYGVYCVPQSVVYHVGGGTLTYDTPRKAYLNFRNMLVTSFKNEPLGKLFWWLPLRLALDGLAGAMFLVQKKYGHLGAIVQAHWTFLPKLGYWWRRRRYYQELIDRAAIAAPRLDGGLYPGSVVWDYYAMGRHRFDQLSAVPSLPAPKASAE